MKSNNDHSHATNVRNFEALLTYIATLDTRYAPSPDRLKLSALQSRLTSTKGIMNALIAAEHADLEARDRRRDLFDTLAPLAVRVVRIFSLCDVSEHTIETAVSIRKKIQGIRITPAPKSEAGGENGTGGHKSAEHDAAQTSFMFMVQHLRHLIATLATAPDYDPNEIELKKASLETLADSLDAANLETDTTGAALDKLRLDRNRTLYRDEDGLVKLAKDVKSYVTAVFGPKSEEGVRITSFAFIDRQFNETTPTTPDPA